MEALQRDLERFREMAFAQVMDCGELIERFHELSKKDREGGDFALLRKLYGWVFVPLSLWPVDLKGLAMHVLERIESGRQVDEKARLMAELLPQAPGEDVCEPIRASEHGVKAGNYEELIEAQYKFDLLEKELAENPEWRADWERIKREFEVDRYRNNKGIIRRRMVQERNFRPADWKFSWGTEAQRFQNVFDAFCHKWNLYGIEEDRPLLLKLTVNVTPYGTVVMIPKYWSFDPRRDLKWKEIMRLHRVRSAQKQGVKLSLNRAERAREAERARRLWSEATRAGMKGDRRKQWVIERLGWDARTDESRLRRLLQT
jgi:hypothetical protein